MADMGLTMDPLSQNRYALAAGNPTSNIEFDGHRLIANGGGGGSPQPQPEAANNDVLKDAGTSREEYENAKSLDKEFDVGKKLVELGLDFLGVNDIKDCITNPSIGSCAMAVANFIPWGKIFKAGKMGKRLFELAGEFMEWRKARASADALLSRVDDAAKRADGAATKADNPGTSCKLPNSFTGDTRVVMADGSRTPIRAVKVGDSVRAKDPATGKVTARKVTATVHTSGDKQVVVLRTADGGRIVATSGHPVWDADSRRWVEAGLLTVGDELVSGAGTRTAVASVTAQLRSTDVFNLSVEVDHTYLVDTGTSTALVHNCENGSAAEETVDKAARNGAQSSGRTGTTKAGAEAAEEGATLTSRAARRQAMREQGIPTSQQPSSQLNTVAGRQYTYDVPAEGGGTRVMTVTDQTTDAVRGHGPHWEAGAAKLPLRKDPLERLRVVNDKSRVPYVP